MEAGLLATLAGLVVAIVAGYFAWRQLGLAAEGLAADTAARAEEDARRRAEMAAARRLTRAALHREMEVVQAALLGDARAYEGGHSGGPNEDTARRRAFLETQGELYWRLAYVFLPVSSRVLDGVLADPGGAFTEPDEDLLRHLADLRGTLLAYNNAAQVKLTLVPSVVGRMPRRVEDADQVSGLRQVTQKLLAVDEEVAHARAATLGHLSRILERVAAPPA